MEGENGVTRSILLEGSMINFILRMSKEMKWKVKMVLLEVSLTNFILQISERSNGT